MSQSHSFEIQRSMELPNSYLSSTSFIQSHITEESDNYEVIEIDEIIQDHQNRTKIIDVITIDCDSCSSNSSNSVEVIDEITCQSGVISSLPESSENALKPTSFSQVRIEFETVPNVESQFTTVLQKTNQFFNPNDVKKEPPDSNESTSRPSVEAISHKKQPKRELDEKLQCLREIRKKFKTEPEDDDAHASSNGQTTYTSELKASENTISDEFKCKEKYDSSEREKIKTEPEDGNSNNGETRDTSERKVNENTSSDEFKCKAKEYSSDGKEIKTEPDDVSSKTANNGETRDISEQKVIDNTSSDEFKCKEKNCGLKRKKIKTEPEDANFNAANNGETRDISVQKASENTSLDKFKCIEKNISAERKKIKTEPEDDDSHTSSNGETSDMKSSEDTSSDEFKSKEHNAVFEMKTIWSVNSISKQSAVEKGNSLSVSTEFDVSKQNPESENSPKNRKVRENFSTDILKYFSVVSQLEKASVKEAADYLKRYKPKDRCVLFRSNAVQLDKRASCISSGNPDNLFQKNDVFPSNLGIEKQFTFNEHFQSDFGLHSPEKTSTRTETNFSSQIPVKVSKQPSTTHNLPRSGLHPPVYSSFERTCESSSPAASSSFAISNQHNVVQPCFESRRGEKSSLCQTVGKESINRYFDTLVLQWNPDWLITQEETDVCPPICDSYLSVKNSYADETEYYDTYSPLHLLSLWLNIYDSWKKQKGKEFTCVFSFKEQVMIRENVLHFKCTAQLQNPYDFPKRRDIVLCKNRITQEEVFLRVVLTEIIEPDPNKIQTQYLTFESLKDFTIRPGDSLDICVLLNIGSASLQSEALMSLNPTLKNLVLKPDSFTQHMEVFNVAPEHSVRNHRDGILNILASDRISVVMVDARYPYEDIKLIKHIVYKIKDHCKVLICMKNEDWFIHLVEHLMPCDPVLVVRSKDILSKRFNKFKKNTLEAAPSKESRLSTVKNSNLFITKLGAFQSKDRKLLAQEKLVCIIDEAHLCTEAETAIPLSLKVKKLLLLGYRVMKADLPEPLVDHGYDTTLYHRFLNVN